NDNIILLGVSGYRDYSYQEKLYNDKVNRSGKEEADKYVAQAGESEHQTGLAMDVLAEEYTTLDEGFKNTKAYKWIIENCYKYGFILRYPEGKEQITGYAYEPWHIRYVGDKVAMEIARKGITLEEYLNISIANK
ncbi:MAG: M15 family metallopeptidase, partial [Clostridiaceae bacterium]|nr:M15 family metallopeptidase [Clostridiaceae bacterium]